MPSLAESINAEMGELASARLVNSHDSTHISPDFSSTSLRETATIGIVTALPLEFAAVCNILSCSATEFVNGRPYRLATVSQRRGSDVSVVVMCLDDMGNTSAAAGAMALVGDCKSVRAVIMCGIAGGVPNPLKVDDDVRLGDIVVPDKRGIAGYEHESVRESGVEIRDRHSPISRTLLGASRLLATNALSGDRPWDVYIDAGIERFSKEDPATGHRWERPSAESDELREFSPKRKIDHLKRVLCRLGISLGSSKYDAISRMADITRIPNRPKIFHGPIASASKLQRNRETRDFLQKKFGAMAIDMESSGVAEAAFESGIEFFAVRAVSDYCNEHKSDKWQPYAAIAAAAYTRALLDLTHLPTPAFERVGVVTSPEAPTVSAKLDGDLEKTVRDALEVQGNRTLEELKRYLDTWEFRAAFELSRGQEAWIENNKTYLSTELIKSLYLMLARVEIVRAGQAKKSGKIDTRQADYFLEKAKDV